MMALVSFTLYRESYAPACTECDFWAIHRSQVVQGDLPVVYPVD